MTAGGPLPSHTISAFTLVKGALVEETYAAFRAWDFSLSKSENLARFRQGNPIGATSPNWIRDLCKALHRRFDPGGRDRPLVELAQAGCDWRVWKPLLLWHVTRTESLLRDFLVHWLYLRYADGIDRLRVEDVVPYLRQVRKKKQFRRIGAWSEATTRRVATALLRAAADFGLLAGKQVKRFTSYALPEESFLYLVYAMHDTQPNARRMLEAPDWHMYLMDASDVERELLRLHQFRKVHFETAGSLARLELPHRSLAEYAKELIP